jgi:23S rRNA (cytosine1962-C5)-methyltransferase
MRCRLAEIRVHSSVGCDCFVKKKQRGGGRSAQPSRTRTSASGIRENDNPGLMIKQRHELMPPASGSIPSVHLKSFTRAPLVYRKRIARTEQARPGDLVAVYAERNQPFAYGLYNPRSELALRIMWRGADYPTADAWTQRLQQAVSLRHDFLKLPAQTSAYRLVHAESDELSGFVVDRFGDVLSAETFSLGFYQRAEQLMPELAQMCDVPHWIVRPAPNFLAQEGCDPPVLQSPDCPQQVTVVENGVRFRIHVAGGHKTGFFCDQRENRQELAKFCEGRSVLDLCCYTGGFSVYAKTLGNADEVTGVDLDAAPLQTARQNANLNQSRIRFVQADAFSWMREMIRNGQQFDVVVLDPPKLLRSRGEIEEGTRRHFALNRLALQLVRKGGLLLTCTCAGLLSESDFTRLVVGASWSEPEADAADNVKRLYQNGGRTVRIFRRSGAAADHPVIGNCPETEYLKAIWMHVD